MAESKPYITNPPDYKKAIATDSDFYIQFKTKDPETDLRIIKMIGRFLEHFELGYLKGPITNVVRELINNAVKANLKRIFFKLRNLDINNPDDYRNGMEHFKPFITESESQGIYEMLDKSKLIVRVLFRSTADTIYLSVFNNVPILENEMVKVKARIKKAYRYHDIIEAFDDVLDDSEGAGLGLIMTVMMFRNAGFPAESLKLFCKEGVTIASIAIPQTPERIRSRIKVAEEILKEVEEIPAFPENIIKIQRLCANPESTIKEIAQSISHDPGLTTSLLKLANSAGYITMKKIESIEEAVKIIGTKGVNTLLLATGVHTIMDSRYKKFESVWADSYKRASYAQKIALQLKQTKISEFVYISSLLSDIGHMVLLSIRPELFMKLHRISGIKGISDYDLIEEISLGISHSRLGSMICKKWHFNDALFSSIEYHHQPYMAPKNLRQLVNIVYLADCMVEVEHNRMKYELIDEDVLEYFNLSDKKSFDLLHTILKDSYAMQIDSERN